MLKFQLIFIANSEVMSMLWYWRDASNHLCLTHDGVEDTEHYFLLCHTYDAKKQDLLNRVNAKFLPHGLIDLSIEEMLIIIFYDYEQLPYDLNVKILTAALEYIQASKTFE